MSLKYSVSILSFGQGKYIAYHRHGKYHRKYRPAKIWLDSSMWWYEYGKSHRLDGPAGYRGGNCPLYVIRGFYYTKEKYESKIRS